MPHMDYAMDLKLDELLTSYVLRDQMGVVPAVRNACRQYIRNMIHQRPTQFAAYAHKVVKQLELWSDAAEPRIIEMLHELNVIEFIGFEVQHNRNMPAWRPVDALYIKMRDAMEQSFDTTRFVKP